MAQTARISARSNHGCWTCRLRRKKCDETRPTCSACSSLDLACHGYGPRPDWMDNGVQQKDRASQFKRLVSLSRSRVKRRQQPPGGTRLPGVAPPSGTRSPSSENSSFGASSTLDHINQLLNTSSQTDHCQHQDCGMNLSSVADSLGGFGSFENITGGASSVFDWEKDSYGDTNRVSHNQNAVCHSVSPEWPHSTTEWAPDIIINDSMNILQTQVQSTDGDMFPPSPYESHRVEAIATDDVASRALQDQILSESTEEGTEDALFMTYLDQVFYLQYPFFHSQECRGRGWLFSILRRVKSVYYSSLALSEQFLLSSLLRSNDVTASLLHSRARNGHYNVAIQELQLLIDHLHTLNGRAHFISTLEILMSLLQLLYFEVFNGGRENWQRHLRTACDLIPTLLQARAPPIVLQRIGENSNQLPGIVVCSEIMDAVNFLLGSFISLDIISSASTRSPLVLKINHLQLLSNLGDSLGSIVGCCSSVLGIILRICQLDRWKVEAQEANNLSIIGLAKRGGELQECLQKELAEIERKLLAQKPIWNTTSSRTTPALSHPEISKIYALSAVTYLHVVVSGSHPGIPEIAGSVSATITAFRDLGDPRQLQSLVWPFCITGCLAVEHQYDVFRDLKSGAGMSQCPSSVLLKAFKIMEECWEARVTCSETCDWATVMRKRGCYTLLR